MQKVLIINGSYRTHGISDQISNTIQTKLQAENIATSSVILREKNIHFCTNCRECTQSSQDYPQKCVIDDDFNDIVTLIEESTTLIFVVPTNLYSATALFKCFMERLIVYAYYPWGNKAPILRKKNLDKKALIFSSCAAPAFIGKMLFCTNKQLKETAKILGAKVLQSTFIGKCALKKEYALCHDEKSKIEKVIAKHICHA